MHGEAHFNAPGRAFARLAALVACAFALAGCHAWHPATYAPPDFTFIPLPPQTNPLVVPAGDQDFVWDQIVDVVDDYFRIEHEERVRIVGDIPTEGRMDTYPRSSSTIFEPWNPDSVNFYERWEATLQSMRRRALVRVIPAPDGSYTVDVQVYKELENVPRPESGAISQANSQTLRNDDALNRVSSPLGGQEPTLGWIGVGRDLALEQEILAHIQNRLGGVPAPPMGIPGQPLETIPAQPLPVISGETLPAAPPQMLPPPPTQPQPF